MAATESAKAVASSLSFLEKVGSFIAYAYPFIVSLFQYLQFYSNIASWIAMEKLTQIQGILSEN